MSLTFRDATAADLPFIVRLIADDAVAETPDRADAPDHPAYLKALAAIDADPHQRLIIAEHDGRPAGMLQLTLIPGIARLGETRALVEAVHVAPDMRNLGIGSQLIQWAIAEARTANCGLVQLTSNKQRLDAHRFYNRLGFVASHEGFKLKL